MSNQVDETRSWIKRNAALLAFLLIAAAAAYGNFQAFNLAEDNKEALDGIAVNRDLNCRATEAKHLEEIDNLKDTYEILKDPPAVYKELLQNPIVLGQFRETILAAANDQDTAGEFVSPACDEPGVGLAEPDPINVMVPDYVEALLPGITEQVADAENNGVEDPDRAPLKP